MPRAVCIFWQFHSCAAFSEAYDVKPRPDTPNARCKGRQPVEDYLLCKYSTNVLNLVGILLTPCEESLSPAEKRRWAYVPKPSAVQYLKTISTRLLE